MAGASAAWGQTASSADKDFLKDTAQDSNYEIKTGQLALQKSSSADVKQYANMVIQDHTQLEQQEAAAQASADTNAKPVLDMSVSDAASYSKLKLLSGDSFDQAYIKGLLSGNDEAVQKAKGEAPSSTVPRSTPSTPNARSCSPKRTMWKLGSRICLSIPGKTAAEIADPDATAGAAIGETPHPASSSLQPVPKAGAPAKA